MKKILIIEDQTNLREGYQILLGKEYSYSSAASATEAIALIAAGPYDKITCDYHLLRGTTGVEVYEWIVANKPEILDSFAFVCAALDKVRHLDALLIEKGDFRGLKAWVDLD